MERGTGARAVSKGRTATPSECCNTNAAHTGGELPSCRELLAKLQEIHRAEGPAEKVLIMAQWPEVLVRLHAALEAVGVAALRLTGDAEAVQLALRAFTEGTGPATAVLLLSTAEHCSGLTLTMARHLFLVHPFLADEREAVAATRSHRTCEAIRQRDAYH